MPDIQCLPSHVADLIAAGEVVERPASVAKELLENAIDAGSSAIVVEIQHGGLTYLRIADNGCGIDAEQLPTAFLRHATSKLRTAADLTAIGTLGFRGEALAAISAVSRVDIFSRRTGAETGASLHLEGGVPGQVEEVGCPEGTTICVRDLFYNTPARMKFMKKDSAEGAAVSGIVQHLALSHPEISFKLIRDGVELLHTPGDGDLQSAVYAAMGRDFTMGLLPISGRSGDISVEGFVTKPLNGHGTRGRQLFFVNSRFIKSQLLTAALEEAYRNQLLKGKFPGCVLRLTMPADRLDVNVHPAKTVVKFVNDKDAFNAVYYTVLDALNTPAPQPKKPPQESFYQTMTVQQYRERAPQPEEKKPLGSYTVRPAAPASQPLEVHDVAPRRGESFTVTSSGVSYRITPPAVQEEPSAPAASVPEETVPVPAEPVQETSVPSPAEEKTAPQSAVQQTVEPVRQAPWRVAGEVLRTYIICEDGQENVWLIDKHAAHERVRFDALKNNTQPVMSQQLLSPLAVELSAEDAASLLEQLPLLEEFGFVCEDFGDGTVLVRQVPSDLEVGDVPAALEELAEELRLNRADPAAARDSLLQTMACKSAIKAGMWSDPSELQALVDKVQSGEIRYCPHGRPVAVKLSKYEMEKMFKRA
ncbi:MAG: DNA mismatch repair endonuclease MutL [Oscillospiraceae bacterium]|nr:DNA mismatch repair endonuclease MutL [Oscillospiraceae bacterium]